MLEGGPAVDEGLALGDQAFEFDRAHFGAVLFHLAALLPVFVVVELTLRAGGLFVEEIGEVPEKVVEIGLEAGVTECAAKDVEEVRDCAGDKVRVGKRAGIGFASGRLIAVEFEVLDHAGGRGTVMRWFEVVCRRHGVSPLEVEAAPCGLCGEARARGGGGGCTAGLGPRPERSGGRREGRLFCFAMQSVPPILSWGDAAENKWTRAVALRPRLWLPRHPQRPRGGPSS